MQSIIGKERGHLEMGQLCRQLIKLATHLASKRIRMIRERESCCKSKTCGKRKSYKGVRVDMRQEDVVQTDGKT
eukprot:scaffold7346_cov154-Skeletonema_menzelii.AAC.10